MRPTYGKIRPTYVSRERDRLGQRRGEPRLAHQMLIDRASGTATFGDRPDDQGLSALHVAGGEDAGHVGHPPIVAPDVPPLGETQPEVVDERPALGTHEAHGQKD